MHNSGANIIYLFIFILASSFMIGAHLRQRVYNTQSLFQINILIYKLLNYIFVVLDELEFLFL